MPVRELRAENIKELQEELGKVIALLKPNCNAGGCGSGDICVRVIERISYRNRDIKAYEVDLLFCSNCGTTYYILRQRDLLDGLVELCAFNPQYFDRLELIRQRQLY